MWPCVSISKLRCSQSINTPVFHVSNAQAVIFICIMNMKTGPWLPGNGKRSLEGVWGGVSGQRQEEGGRVRSSLNFTSMSWVTLTAKVDNGEEAR